MKNNYGMFHFKIEEVLNKKKISKNKLCKDMEILRPNLNSYCKDQVQRFDSLFLRKLCYYLDCTLDDLIEYIQPNAIDSEVKRVEKLVEYVVVTRKYIVNVLSQKIIESRN